MDILQYVTEIKENVLLISWLNNVRFVNPQILFSLMEVSPRGIGISFSVLLREVGEVLLA